jgi:hypothetical protein
VVLVGLSCFELARAQRHDGVNCASRGSKGKSRCGPSLLGQSLEHTPVHPLVVRNNARSEQLTRSLARSEARRRINAELRQLSFYTARPEPAQGRAYFNSRASESRDWSVVLSMCGKGDQERDENGYRRPTLAAILS